MSNHEHTARIHELITNGYALFPFPHEEAVAAAHRAFSVFLEECADPDLWALSWPGAPRPSAGLIYRDGEVRPSGEKSDRKYFWHYAPGVRELIRERALSIDTAAPLVDASEALFGECHALATQVLEGLEKTLTESTPYQAFCDADSSATSTDRNTVRLLYYPPREAEESECARPHTDRSFLTVHVGDVGGELQITSESDGSVRSVSPPPGYALVFFGEKARRYSRELPSAVLHSSRVESGKERRAAVFFAHIDV